MARIQTILAGNLARVRGRIERAAIDAGRDPAAVRLVAITKSVEPEVALALARLGHGEFGESRTGELERKARAFGEAAVEARWHLVGHLQRNKARRAVRVAERIHSVDSQRLLATLERVAAEEGRHPEVHLEVHLSGEPEKSGFPPEALVAAARAAARLSAVRLVGLMTLAPRPVPGRDRSAAARAVFERLAALGRDLERDPLVGPRLPGGRCELSMGMSGDLEAAVVAGADLVRVGSALFAGLPGHRQGTLSNSPDRGEEGGER